MSCVAQTGKPNSAPFDLCTKKGRKPCDTVNDVARSVGKRVSDMRRTMMGVEEGGKYGHVSWSKEIIHVVMLC